MTGLFDIEVYGTEGRTYAWDNGEVIRIRRGTRRENIVEESSIKAASESPTACNIRNIIQQLETGERTAGNIDVTMPAVETQFAIAHFHLQGGTCVEVPVADRSLYIPGG